MIMKSDDSVSKRKRLLLVGIIVSLLFVISGIVSVSVGLTLGKNNNDDDNNNLEQSIEESSPGPSSSLLSPSSSESANDDGKPLNGTTNESHGDVNDVDVTINKNTTRDDPSMNVGQHAPNLTRDTVPVVNCPEPESDPITIEIPIGDNVTVYQVLLTTSAPGILCTLMEANDSQSTTGDLGLKPVGRSYNGNGWEAYRSSYFANVIPSICSVDDSNSDVDNTVSCMVDLPIPSTGRRYILKSYRYGLSTKDQAARFLEKTTFGPTIAEISSFTTPHEWMTAQLEYPPTSHRQFFRERSTSWHTETTYQGLLHAGPCEEGARYRKYVFLAKDATRFLTIETSSIDTNKRVLSVGGHVRSVIDGRVKRGWPETILAVVDNGSYEICYTPEEKIGGMVLIKVDGVCQHAYFDGVYGNPPVKFPGLEYLPDTVVDIDESIMTPVMTQFFSGSNDVNQILQLSSPLSDQGCPTSVVGAPEVVTIGFDGISYLIHTPSFQLLSNELDSPLPDGGKEAVIATANAPDDRMVTRCSNAPRTFLNEESCVLSPSACRGDGTSTMESVVVCGSPYETASVHTVNSGTFGRGGFELATQFNRTAPTDRLVEQRETVWLEIALNGNDQLRQRMAWALSQILVVSPNSIAIAEHVESFLTYYDIFVRNAFGNYFDILKEVTYSPMMAEMLTFVNGKSTGFVWSKDQQLQFADENYARELLQLFTLGLYLLNDDGTIQRDAIGNELRTYKNNHIPEYARIFVGFQPQQKRGNIEDRTLPQYQNNPIDPMRINVEFKDHFPKLGMNDQYVGDGYPLCRDLPGMHFLKKGATFRLLGSDPRPELVTNPNEWFGAVPDRLSLDASSELSLILCNGNVTTCSPKGKVKLDSDLACSGLECSIQDLQTFEVGGGSGIFFEYVRPPCVNFAFHQNAKSIRRRKGELHFAMCGDPTTQAASTICCDGTGSTLRDEKFSGERVHFDIAESRCSDQSKSLCSNPVATDSDCTNNAGCDDFGMYYWSSLSCTHTAKIDKEGKVALIHEPQIEGVDTHKMFTSDTQMYFRVDWQSNDIAQMIAELASQCSTFGCDDGEDGTCLCNATVQEASVFSADSEIASAYDVLSRATVGAFPPSPNDVGQAVNGIAGLWKFPAGDGVSEETVFKVVDSFGRVHYRKNVKSTVSLGNGGLSFRNPVNFYTLSDPSTRDAAYETDAALEHAFYHQNLAPFLAIRLAQRFGVSNPSPRFVTSIVQAFRSGNFKDSTSGNEFGSGQYGCLKATIAAVLLDRESKDALLDADPFHGSVLEPYLKIVRVLRSLEFEPNKNSPLLTVKSNLQGMIGQQAHKLPHVFSFFKPEYQPAGRVGTAGLCSPEAQVLTGPASVQMTNAIISYLKYGVSSCYGGFGYAEPHVCKIDGPKYWSNGGSTYNPSNSGLQTSNVIIDELATLLTSGRLGEDKRNIIKLAYNSSITAGKSEGEALIDAQQLIVTTPEFHTTGLARSIGQNRAVPADPTSTGIPYKAVIFVMLPGGYDSYNVLVPKTCAGTNPSGQTVDAQYLEQRGKLALTAAARELGLTINVTDQNQPCSQFAIHDELKIVKKLYDAGDLSFLANVGVINQGGMTKTNFHELTRTQLFAHNTMQRETATVDPFDEHSGTGVLGRMKDILTGKGHIVNTISIDGPSIAVEGKVGESPPATIVGRSGSQIFASRPESEQSFDIEGFSQALNDRVDEFSGIFAEAWSHQFVTGIDEGRKFQTYFNAATLDDSIWNNNGSPAYNGELEREHYEKWATIAQLIQTRQLRNVDRDVFFTNLGSWDHHSDMKLNLRTHLKALNHGLDLFVNQLKVDGTFDDVVVVITSDFGRTFTPNSNEGSDHGWGGHYMILGGGVKGGQILGQYPSDLSPGGLLVDGRGRFLPTTSWDAVWNGVFEWFGVDSQEELDYCLPNAGNTISAVEGAGTFPLFTKSDIFQATVTSSEGTPSKRLLRARSY